MRLPRSSKGQSSLELLIILAIGLVVLGLVISTSQQRIASSSQALSFSQAKSSVSLLAQAADAVYLEGAGARREVKFVIPDGVLSTSIAQHSISMKVASQNGGSDAAANTRALLCGNSFLPTAPGTYYIVVEGLDGCVALGANSKLIVSSTLISESAASGQSFVRTLKYSNLGNSPIQVDLSLDFVSPDVLAEFIDPADVLFTLPALGEKDVLINFTTSNSALGSNSGALYANGSEGTNLTTSIFIEVFGQTCQQQTCAGGGANVSLIEIKTYSSNSYSQLKDIFDPPEDILLEGGNWDAFSSLNLDVRDPTDAFSFSGYPKSLVTNSSGGFNGTLSAGGLTGLTGYIVRASGISAGSPEIRTANFDITSCN
ncbi:MAG: hypothetical protein AABX01_03425 [Candidatus Micrarchaeota archaeon]